MATSLHMICDGLVSLQYAQFYRTFEMMVTVGQLKRNIFGSKYRMRVQAMQELHFNVFQYLYLYIIKSLYIYVEIKIEYVFSR